MWRRRSMLAVLVAAAGAVYGVPVAGAAVLRVGTWNGIRGPYKTIQSPGRAPVTRAWMVLYGPRMPFQAAVNAARPGDWVLVGPGDYKERGYPGEAEPAGVLITTPNIHLRGMDRNGVVVDGTRPGTPACSSQPTDQGALKRDGIEVYK